MRKTNYDFGTKYYISAKTYISANFDNFIKLLPMLCRQNKELEVLKNLNVNNVNDIKEIPYEEGFCHPDIFTMTAYSDEYDVSVSMSSNPASKYAKGDFTLEITLRNPLYTTTRKGTKRFVA